MLTHYATSLGAVCGLDALEDQSTEDETGVTCQVCKELLELHSLCLLSNARDVVFVCTDEVSSRQVALRRFEKALTRRRRVTVWYRTDIAGVQEAIAAQCFVWARPPYVVAATPDADRTAVSVALADHRAIGCVQFSTDFKASEVRWDEGLRPRAAHFTRF